MRYVLQILLFVACFFQFSFSYHSYEGARRISLEEDIFDLLANGSTVDAVGYMNELLQLSSAAVDDIEGQYDLDFNRLSTVYDGSATYSLNITFRFEETSSSLELVNNTATYVFNGDNTLNVTGIVQMPDLTYNIDLDLYDDNDTTISAAGKAEVLNPSMTLMHIFVPDEMGTYELRYQIAFAYSFGDGSPELVFSENITEALRVNVESVVSNNLENSFSDAYFTISDIIDNYSVNVTISDFIY